MDVVSQGKVDQGTDVIRGYWSGGFDPSFNQNNNNILKAIAALLGSLISRRLRPVAAGYVRQPTNILCPIAHTSGSRPPDCTTPKFMLVRCIYACDIVIIAL